MKLFPDKLYIGLYFNDLNTVFGKVVVYDRPELKTTQNNIDSLTNKVSSMIIDNYPQSGWYIIPHWRGQRDESFKLMHPSGLFEFEVTRTNMHQLLKECTIKNGIIQDLCLFNSKKQLIKENGEVYNQILNTRKSTKSLNEELKSLNIGDKISVLCGSQWKTVTYCGKLHGIYENTRNYLLYEKSKLLHVVKMNDIYFMVSKFDNFKKINVNEKIDKETVISEFKYQIINKHYRFSTFNSTHDQTIYFPHVVSPVHVEGKPFALDDLVLKKYKLNIKDFNEISDDKFYKYNGKTVNAFIMESPNIYNRFNRSKTKVDYKNNTADYINIIHNNRKKIPSLYENGNKIDISLVREITVFYYDTP